jgi:hypothetical protein
MNQVPDPDPESTVTTLHITNGDSAGDKLRTFVNGEVTIVADVLHEGPCPPIDGDAWHDVRNTEAGSDGPAEARRFRNTARHIRFGSVRL